MSSPLTGCGENGPVKKVVGHPVAPVGAVAFAVARLGDVALVEVVEEPVHRVVERAVAATLHQPWVQVVHQWPPASWLGWRMRDRRGAG